MALDKTSILAKCGRSLCRQIRWQFRTAWRNFTMTNLNGGRCLDSPRNHVILSTDRVRITRRAFLPRLASTGPFIIFSARFLLRFAGLSFLQDDAICRCAKSLSNSSLRRCLSSCTFLMSNAVLTDRAYTVWMLLPLRRLFCFCLYLFKSSSVTVVNTAPSAQGTRRGGRSP